MSRWLNDPAYRSELARRAVSFRKAARCGDGQKKPVASDRGERWPSRAACVRALNRERKADGRRPMRDSSPVCLAIRKGWWIEGRILSDGESPEMDAGT